MKGKVLILSDVHIGRPYARGGSYAAIEACSELLYKGKEKGCEVLIVAGDLFHHRDRIPSLALMTAHSFINLAQQLYDRVYLLTGNHDMLTSAVGDPNVLQTLSSSNVFVIKNTVDIEDGKILMVPYGESILRDPAALSERAKSSPICICHDTMEGMVPMIADYIPHKDVSCFKWVFAGHIHIHKVIDNVVSIGTPNAMTFADKGITEFGGIILDINTLQWERVLSDKGHLFKEVIYNNDTIDAELSLSPERRAKYNIRILIPESEFITASQYITSHQLHTDWAAIELKRVAEEEDESSSKDEIEIPLTIAEGDNPSIMYIRNEFSNDPRVSALFESLLTEANQAQKQSYVD